MIHPDKLFGRLGNRMFQMAFIYGEMRRGRTTDIYIQNYEYWEMYANEIKDMFRQEITPNNFVAIHVRRGDYVGHPDYVDLMQTDYYQKAMAEFPNSKFKVYSDDIEWCFNQPIFKDCEFSQNITELEDLNDIAGGKGVIMANSSFSWWGAFLSNRKVIAPSKWFTNSTSIKLLKEWKVI
jgi:hypothetical protein